MEETFDQKPSEIQKAAEFTASSIITKLELGQKVFWLVPGGSSMPICVSAAKLINQHQHNNLTITLTDERYGDIGHKDSNWKQLFDLGFMLREARLLPVLTGESFDMTTKNFNAILNQELEENDFKIGSFGMGPDGHTAGILPESIAVRSDSLVEGYDAGIFQRITITPKAIVTLDEAVLFAYGEDKYSALENLESEIDIDIQPAQILKEVKKLTIFSDYKSKYSLK